MNLHGIASAYVSAVNPTQEVTVQQSTGYATLPNGQRTPTYAAPQTVEAQVQELTSDELQMMEGLGIQGESRAIYLNGQFAGAVRADKRGGDLFTLEDGSIWLVVKVLESFPDWTKVAVTRQVA